MTHLLLLLSHFSRVRLSVTPLTTAHQAPPSMGLSRQEYWSGLPLPSLRDLWDNIKHANIGITGVPEEKEKRKGYEKFFEEIIVENFPNMEKEIIKSKRHKESHTR